MHTTHLRTVGASVMLVLPPAIFDLLNLREGVTVGIVVDGGRLVIEPRPSPRLTLAEILAGSEYSTAQSPEDRQWVDVPAVGRELI